MYIRPNTEPKLPAKKEEREREKKRSSTIYIAVLVLQDGKENTMETSLQTIKGGGGRKAEDGNGADAWG